MFDGAQHWSLYRVARGLGGTGQRSEGNAGSDAKLSRMIALLDVNLTALSSQV